MGFYREPKDVLKSKKGVLIDIDGVLLNDGKPLNGGREFLEFLKDIGKPFICITNTTIRSRKEIFYILKEYSFPVSENEILTSTLIANYYLKKKYRTLPICAYVNENVLEDLFDLNLSDDGCTAVLLGDMGDGFSRMVLNEIFVKLMNGADFYAFHKNRFWRVGNELFLDLGAFVSALEYASGVKAKIIGKPSEIIFRESLSILGLSSEEVLIIGDDFESDILGAKKLGIDGILVLTGKYTEEILKRRNFSPEYLIKNLYELL